LLQPLGILLIAYGYARFRTIAWTGLIIAVVAIQVTMGFVADIKSSAMIGGILVILTRTLVDNRLPKAWLLAGALFVIVAFPVFQAYRSEITGERGLSRTQAAMELGKVIEIAVSSRNKVAQKHGEGRSASFFERYRVPRAVAAVLIVTAVCAGAAFMMAPWIVRAVALTGNPIAPLMNQVFPNRYFHIFTEQELAANLRSLGGVQPTQVPWELAFGDHLTGTFGPLLFALPLGLLVLRRHDSFRGRLLWAAVLLLALPWLTNSGARFLMPAVALAAIALGMVLPRPAAWAAIGLQALLCWPHVLDAWETRYSFRLHELPLAAAVGAESEAAYCKRRFEEYNVALMIQKATPPDSRILALVSVANAYLDRDVAVSWQSAEADQLLDTLRLAGLYYKSPTFDWKAVWPEQLLRALRFRMPAGYQGEWDISEVQLLSGEDLIFNSPQWTLGGWPNRWDGPLAFDGNLATRWRTWETVRVGMYLELQLDHPQRLTSAVLVSHTPALNVALEVYGLDVKGQWHLLSNSPQAILRPPKDIRLEAARAVKRAGFRYLLVPTGKDGNAPIGNVIIDREAEWGMESAGDAGRFHLLRIK